MTDSPDTLAFRDILSKLHLDAVRCALADIEAGRPWPAVREERQAIEDAAIECCASLGLHPFAVGAGPAFWLRCYDRAAEALRLPAAPVATGDRVCVHFGEHAGRCGTVLRGPESNDSTVKLDPLTTDGWGPFVRYADITLWASWVCVPTP